MPTGDGAGAGSQGGEAPASGGAAGLGCAHATPPGGMAVEGPDDDTSFASNFDARASLLSCALLPTSEALASLAWAKLHQRSLSLRVPATPSLPLLCCRKQE